MNWKQLFQAIKRTRGGWLSATWKVFADALSNLFPSTAGSRRLKYHAGGQIENLEVRQVLSVANPLASFVAASSPTEVYSSSNSPDISKSSENAPPAASQSISILPFVISQSRQFAMQWQVDDAENNIAQGGFANDLSRRETLEESASEWNSAGDLAPEYDGISNQLLNSATQSIEQKTLSSRISNDLLTVAPGRMIANNPAASLNDDALQDSSPILKDSSPAPLTNVLSNSATAAISNADAETSLQHSGFAPAATPDSALKRVSGESGSASFIWHDAAGDHDAIGTAILANGSRKPRAFTATEFSVRSDAIISAFELPSIANSDTSEQISVNSRRNAGGRDSTTNESVHNWRAALTEFDWFFRDIDLFTSPFLSSIIDDENLQQTVSMTAEETLPTAVPLLTTERMQFHSSQNSSHMTPVRVRQLRDGHRQHSHIAVISTDIIQHDGTPEFAASENIPRQLKHVFLPRGPPRKQPDTVLRIMDSDAEAHVRQRLRYSIAPRGPSTVTVEMQSPEKRSFSGPRVSPEECLSVRLVC